MRRVATVAVAALAASVAFAAPAQACTGEVCDAVNAVCVAVRGEPCVR